MTTVNRDETRAPSAPQKRMLGDDRKQLIQKQAAMLFSQHGYAKTTMRDIAEASGLQKGSLYYFYASKETLLLDLYRESLEIPQRAFDEVVALDVTFREKVRLLIAALVDCYRQMMPWMSTFTRGSLEDIENVEDQDMLKSLARRFQDTWDAVILDGMKAGEFRSDVDHKIASFAILGTINWMYKWYEPDGRLTTETIADNFSALILDGLVA